MTRTPRTSPSPPRDKPDGPTVVRLRSPGEVVASLPALLGYHATNSVVLVVLGGERRRVRLTARVDIPEQRGEHVWHALSHAFVPAAVRSGGDEAILVVLDGDEPFVRELAEVLRADLDRHGVTLADALVVADGRYRSVECHDRCCCPPEGTPVPATGAATAAAVTTGTVIHATRDDLRTEFAGPAPDAADRAERVVALLLSSACHGSIDASPQAVEDALTTGCEAARVGDVPLDQAARLALLVSVGEIRDQTYLHLITTGATAHRRLWASVCRQIPPRHTVVPHVLFGLSAYLGGDGAVATLAVETAEHVDPQHPSVRLLADLIAAGIPPDDVREALARCVPARH
jgi:hypothetical protein